MLRLFGLKFLTPRRRVCLVTEPGKFPMIPIGCFLRLQGAITISTAHQDVQNKWPHRFLVIILPITAAFMLLLGLVIYFWWMRKLKSKESVEPVQESRSQVNNAAAAGDFNGNSPTLILYSLADIETATDKYSIENKFGEGGYGPVYKKIPVERPSMLEVSWMLRNEAPNLMIPNIPGFMEKNDEDVRYDSTTSNLELGSANDMTQSSLEAR
ncbi:hypothetical protein QYF36_017402 [Acer negundo]|nr:hypothetical protein QYF36_017402 [Acer negundo]